LKEGERGNKEEGLGGEKGKRLRGLWLNNHLLPPPRIRTEGGREVAQCGRSAAIPGEPSHGGDWAAVQNEEGLMVIRFPYLPWAGMVCRSGSSGGGGLEVVVLGVAVLGCQWRRGARL
jgi:hypothetical protein